MNLNKVVKQLKTNKTEFAKALGLNPTSIYPWKGKIPEKYHDAVKEMLKNAGAPVGARPVKAKRKKKDDIKVIEVGELKPSSKVMIMIMDADEAEKYAAKFISGEVG